MHFSTKKYFPKKKGEMSESLLFFLQYVLFAFISEWPGCQYMLRLESQLFFNTLDHFIAAIVCYLYVIREEGSILAGVGTGKVGTRETDEPKQDVEGNLIDTSKPIQTNWDEKEAETDRNKQ